MVAASLRCRQVRQALLQLVRSVRGVLSLTRVVRRRSSAAQLCVGPRQP